MGVISLVNIDDVVILQWVGSVLLVECLLVVLDGVGLLIESVDLVLGPLLLTMVTGVQRGHDALDLLVDLGEFHVQLLVLQVGVQLLDEHVSHPVVALDVPHLLSGCLV